MEKEQVHDSDQLQAMTKEALIAMVIELRTTNNRLRKEIMADDRARLRLQSVKESLQNTISFIGDTH